MTAPDPARWRQLRATVAELFDLDAAGCEERLAEIHRHDPDLARDARALLAADERASQSFERAMVEGAAAVLADWRGAAAGEATALKTASAAGLELGTWRLQRLLGRGGMAEVWEARRTAGDFEQTVAVKLLKRGMDSEEIVRRFLAERQILARLDHPGIARLFDGGLAPDGRPYFVLEKVDGEPITEWCAARRSTLPERLRLLVDCCQAVAAAHRQLVVHRDLKPSNILVSRTGQVKLLDFGIAKLLADEEGAAQQATHPEVRMLTPAYAAPEQIRGEPVSTATDVYTLGVLAYELLTGRLPHRRAGRVASELASEVESEAIVRPSTAVLGAAGKLGEAAEDPRGRRRRARELVGDLDTIVLTALRREPERRYSSVAALAEDITRFVEGRPIAARRDRLGYRMRKFVGRHRVAVAAGALAAASLVAGLGASLWQARRAERAAAAARGEATKSEAIAAFLTEVFTAADPEGRQAAELTVRELVERGAERIQQDLEAQPATRAAMLQVLGNVHFRLALHEPARELLEEALAVRRALVPPAPSEVAATAASLGTLYHRQGRSAEGVALLEEALALHQQLRGADSLDVARDLNNLANGYRALGRSEDSRAAFERAVAILDRQPEAEPVLLARTLNNYGLLLDRLGERAQGKVALERALALHERTSGPESALVVGTLGNLAELYVRMGQVEQALAAARRAREIGEKTYGPDHFESGMAANMLCWALLAAGRHEEARLEAARAVEILAATLGPDHRTVGYSHRNHGRALAGLGRTADAIASYRRAVRIWEVPPGANERELASVYVLLAPLLVATGEAEEGERLFEQVVAFRQPLANNVLGASWLGLARTRLARCELVGSQAALARARELAAGVTDPQAEWAVQVPEVEREVQTARCGAPRGR